MKNKLCFLLFAGLAVASCKVRPEPSSAIEYFIFGSAHCHCVNNCARLYKYTPANLVKGEGRWCQPDEYTYAGTTLDANAQARAESLLKKLPEALYTSRDTTFGCPDCADQGTYYVEIKKAGQVRFWRIDTNAGAIPEFLVGFHGDIRETLNVLN